MHGDFHPTFMNLTTSAARLRARTALAATCMAMLVAGCAGSSSGGGEVLNYIGKGEWKVSGRIEDGTGGGLPNMLVHLVAPTQTFSVRTDTKGDYAFQKMENGSYNVRPMQLGYGFEPTFRDITINGGDVEVAPFVGALSGGGGGADGSGGDVDAGGGGDAGDTTGGNPAFWKGGSISGVVRLRDWATEQPGDREVPGVLVTIRQGTESMSTYSKPDGSWSFLGKIPDGDFTLTYAKDGWTIEPAQRSITVKKGVFPPSGSYDVTAHSSIIATDDVVLGDYANPQVRIVGKDGKPLTFIACVLVHDVKKEIAWAQSQDGGWASFPGILNGSYRLYPIQEGYAFVPEWIDFTFAGPDAGEQWAYHTIKTEIVATPTDGAKHFRYTLHGRVLDAAGKGVAGAFVAAAGVSVMGYSNTTSTGADGSWTLEDVEHFGTEPIVVYAEPAEVSLAQPFRFVTPEALDVVVPDFQ